MRDAGVGAAGTRRPRKVNPLRRHRGDRRVERPTAIQAFRPVFAAEHCPAAVLAQQSGHQTPRSCTTRTSRLANRGKARMIGGFTLR